MPLKNLGGYVGKLIFESHIYLGFVIYFYAVIGAIFYVVGRIREEKNEARCRQETESANSIGQQSYMPPNNMGENTSA